MDELNETYGTATTHLLPCAICHESDVGIYKCPKCSLITCSLTCCKKHKEINKCDGKRDKTAYIPLQAYNDSNLKSDFHFLEDVLQSKDNAKRVLRTSLANSSNSNPNMHNSSNKKHKTSQRKPSKTSGTNLNILSHQNLDNHHPHTRKLVKEAQAAHVNLIVMPEGMTKRKSNTSRWNPQSSCLSWRLHMIFILKPIESIAAVLQYDYLSLTSPVSIIDGSILSFYCDDINDNTTLLSVLDSILTPNPGNTILRQTLKEISKYRLKLKCFIQKLPSASNSPSFYEVDQDLTIQQILNGKTVYEYPMFIVSFDENIQAIKLLMSIDSASEEPIPCIVNYLSIQESLKLDDNDLSGSIAAQQEQILKDGICNEGEEHGLVADYGEEDFLTLLKKYETEDIEKLRQIVEEEGTIMME